MKKIIVIAGCIILGVYIYNLVLGDDENTLKTQSKKVMQRQIQEYKIEP